MEDLISKQAVIDACDQSINILEAVDRIMDLPSVEQEQKTGHWILGVCDNCGYDWGKDAPIASTPNFCPNCGARMESEEA